jgi:hypothetical protein
MTASNQVSSMSGSRGSLKCPTADLEHLLIVATTGMVGGYALRYVLDHTTIGSVTSIVRRKLDT